MHIHSSDARLALFSQPPAHKDEGGAQEPSEDSPKRSESVQVSLSSRSVQLSHSTSVNEAAPVEAAEPKKPDTETNQYAGAILSAISGQLHLDQSNGHDTDQLQSRMEAGLSGFLQGFGEAFAQLDAIPEFSNDIKAEVYETKTQVLAGLADLADDLGLDKSAITAAQETHAEDVALLEGTSEGVELPGVLGRFANASAFQAKENTFSFELETADGDKVTILASTLDAVRIQQEKNEAQAERAERNSFSLEVEGELDEGELAAINDLLNQVGSVSDSFFSGNVEGAFQQALGMGFDSSEIQGFALQLTRTVSTQVQGAYEPSEPKAGAAPSRNLAETSGFYRELESTFESADQYSVERQIVVKLLESVAVAKGNDPETLSKILESNNSEQAG